IQGAKSLSNWWREGPRVERKRLTWAAKLPVQSGKSGVVIIGQSLYCPIDSHAKVSFMKNLSDEAKNANSANDGSLPAAYRRLRARLNRVGWLGPGERIGARPAGPGWPSLPVVPSGQGKDRHGRLESGAVCLAEAGDCQPAQGGGSAGADAPDESGVYVENTAEHLPSQATQQEYLRH